MLNKTDRSRLSRMIQANGLDDILLELVAHAFARVGTDNGPPVYGLLAEMRERYKSILDSDRSPPPTVRPGGRRTKG